jgi:hypothetical protein
MVSSSFLLSLFLLPASSSCLVSSLSRGNDDITGVLFENRRRPETTEEPQTFLRNGGTDSSPLQLPQQHLLLGAGGGGMEYKGDGGGGQLMDGRGDREQLSDERQQLASGGGTEKLSGGVGRDYLGSYYTREQLGSRRVGGGREQLSSSIREQLGGNIRKQVSGSSAEQLTDGGGEQLSSSSRGQLSGRREQLSGGEWEQLSGGSRGQLSGGSREQQLNGGSREQLSGGSREQQIVVGSEEQQSGGSREQLDWDHSISDYGTDRRQGDRVDNSRQMSDSAETLPLGDPNSRLLGVPAESSRESADSFRHHHHPPSGLRAALPSQGQARAATSSSSSSSLLSWGEQLDGSLTEERKQLPDTASEMLSKLAKGE